MTGVAHGERKCAIAPHATDKDDAKRSREATDTRKPREQQEHHERCERPNQEVDQYRAHSVLTCHKHVEHYLEMLLEACRA